MNRALAVIPARGGSKTLPGKNVRDIAGKPLLAWSVEAALASAQFDRVIVSTDDPEIASVARHAGADVPFLRPAALAQDNIPTVAVILHTLDYIERTRDPLPEWVMVLQPTSPLRTAEDIRRAAEMTDNDGVQSVVSVTEATPHPYLVGQIRPDGVLCEVPALNLEDSRRQAFPPLYALNGAIYLNQTEVIKAERKLITTSTHAYIMPPERSIDIDTLWQLRLAELVMEDSRG